MAITVTSQMTDVLVSPTQGTKIGTGNATATETVINPPGSTSASAIGHSGSVGPTAPSSISQFRGMKNTVTGFTRTGMHLHITVRDLYPVRDVNVGGLSFYINGTSEAIYYMSGADVGYAGDYIHLVLNLDPTTRPAASLGTAPSSNIVNMGYAGNISGTKGETFLQNCYWALGRRGTAGQGITITGGTSGARHTLADAAQGDTLGTGLFQLKKGALFIEGPLTFGGAALNTYIQDSLKTVNFNNFTVNNSTGGNTVVSAVASDYYRIVMADGTTAVTDFNVPDIIWNGASRNQPFSFTASALSTGDSYNCPRATYIFGSTVTFGAQCTSTDEKFVECQTVVPNGITLTRPIFSNTDAVTLTAVGDKISGGSTTLHNTTAGTAFVTTDDLLKIENHSFDNTGGTGHAFTSNSVGIKTVTGNILTGYHSVTDQTLHQFDNTTDVIGGVTDTITLPAGHGYVDGDGIVYSKMLTANTAIGGLTDDTVYYVNTTGNAMTLHTTEAEAIAGTPVINLTAGTGNETHALWPANAAYYNSSTGSQTYNIAGGGTTPSVRNALNATTIVNNTVNLTVTVKDEEGVAINLAQASIHLAASPFTELMNTTTNASGVATTTFNYSTDTSVIIKVRKSSTGATRYQNFSKQDTITSSGLTLAVAMRINTIASA